MYLDETESLRQGDVATIREWGNDKTTTVANVLVAVAELGISNHDRALAELIIPGHAQLGLPSKHESVIGIRVDQVRHDITVKIKKK